MTAPPPTRSSVPASRRRWRATLATRIFAPEPAAASFRLAALVTGLVRAGADVTVVTVTVPGRAADPRREGVRVRRRPVLRDKTGYVRGYAQYASFDVPLLLRLLFSRRPDVVVAEPPPTTGAVVRAVCAVRRLPYVYYAADVWSDAATSTGAPRLVVKLLRAVESWTLRGASRVLAVSPEMGRRVRELGARDVTVVPNGIDTEVFSADGPRADDAPSGPYAVYAGTTSEWQGADVFVRAMAKVRSAVPGASLVVVGQGSGWEDLVEAAAELPDGGACVRLLPPVAAPGAAAWQRGAALAVVSLRPGIGYDFAIPTKVLAGAACGTPVLFAGPQGPASDLVRTARIGRAVDYDVDQVSDAMITMMTDLPDDAERRRLAEWADEKASARSASARAAAAVRAAAGGPPDPRDE